MPRIVERNLIFDFPASWDVVKYDERYDYYLHKFQHTAGADAVDILALDATSCCWLIEAKDHRSRGHQTTVAMLADKVTQKARDTLAGLAAARILGSRADQRVAQQALSCAAIRVVLHLEPPPVTSPFHPQAIPVANLQIELKRLVRAIDPNPMVVEIGNMRNLPWTVQ